MVWRVGRSRGRLQRKFRESDIGGGDNPLHAVQPPVSPLPAPRVELFGIAALMGGTVIFSSIPDERPIANKYREGKMKSTLKRE